MKKLAVGIALCATVVCARGDATACGHSMLTKTDPTVVILAEAERLVDNGNPKDAIAWVATANPRFATSEVGSGPLATYALSVLARAVVRSDGRHRPLALFPIPTANGAEATASDEEAARVAALAWAAATLAAVREKAPDDPARTTAYAEALARDPARQGEALALLIDLERSSLMTSPQGYAALAKLRKENTADRPSFTAGPLAALSAGHIALDNLRCESMTKDPGICNGTPRQPAKPNFAGLAAVISQNDAIDRSNRRRFGLGRF